MVSSVLALWKCAVDLSSFPSTHSTVQFTVTGNLFALAEMWDWQTYFAGTLSLVQSVSSARCYPPGLAVGSARQWARIVSSRSWNVLTLKNEWRTIGSSQSEASMFLKSGLKWSCCKNRFTSSRDLVLYWREQWHFLLRAVNDDAVTLVHRCCVN